MKMMEPEHNTQRVIPWHMDKSVSLGTLLALGVQTLTILVLGLSWVNGIDARVAALEAQRVTDARVVALEKEIANTQNQLGQVHTTTSRIADDVVEIKIALGVARDTSRKTK
jgi:hypothetical protein